VRAEWAGTLELAYGCDAGHPERRERGGEADAFRPACLQADRLDMADRRLERPRDLLGSIDRMDSDGAMSRPRLESSAIFEDYRPRRGAR